MTTPITTACVLIIGNEILSGKTQDTNLQFLGSELAKRGVSLKEARVLVDEKNDIVKTLNECRTRYDYVITTGGIGPTHDDITAQSISKAFKVKYEYHKEAYAILEKYYGKKKFNDGRKKMAKLPRGAKLIYNPSSAAPGFIIKNVLSLPMHPYLEENVIIYITENINNFIKKY